MQYDVMDEFTDEQRAQACMLRARADYLVCYYGTQRFRGPLTIPDDWTVWLLMDKAGVPRELIAYFCYVPRAVLVKRLRLATAMLIFSPFAARINFLSQRMPRFSAPGRNAQPKLLEAACVAQVE